MQSSLYGVLILTAFTLERRFSNLLEDYETRESIKLLTLLLFSLIAESVIFLIGLGSETVKVVFKFVLFVPLNCFLPLTACFYAFIIEAVLIESRAFRIITCRFFL